MLKKIFVFMVMTTCWLITLPGKINLSNTPSKSVYPQLVIDGRNQIHVVWVEMSGSRGDVYYIMYNGTTWSTPTNISNRHQIRMDDNTWLNLAIDCDPNNNIYVIWNESNQIRMRTKSPTSGWRSQSAVATANALADGIRLSVLDSNRLAVAWWTASGIYSRARINNRWESVRRVNSSSSRSKFPDIHVGRTSMYINWVNKSGGDYVTKYSRRGLTYNAGWATESILYNDHHSASFPRITITSSTNIPYGSFLSYHDGPKIFYVSSRSGGSFETPDAVSSLSIIHFPTLYSRGDVLYASWQVGPYENGRGIYYSVNGGGAWSDQDMVPGSNGAKSADIGASTDHKIIHVAWDSDGEIYFTSIGGEEPVPIPNKPPKARFTYWPYEGLYPLEVKFDASNSIDEDGKIRSYKWDFGDGKNGSGKAINHTFFEKGVYQIELTVTDDDGDSDSITAMVNVFGISPPINIYFERFENRSLFSIEYIYKITWNKNPLNAAVGSNVVQFKIFRRDKGLNEYAYFATVKAKEDNIYYDRTLGRTKKEYEYMIVSVDIDGRESELYPDQGNEEDENPTTNHFIKKQIIK